MTEEEFFIKNYPDSCYGNKSLSPHWDFFQDGVEFGERKAEKQIQIDAKQVRALQKQSGELTDRLTKAEEIIKNLLFLHNDKFGSTRLEWRCNVVAEAEQFLKENA